MAMAARPRYRLSILVCMRVARSPACSLSLVRARALSLSFSLTHITPVNTHTHISFSLAHTHAGTHTEISLSSPPICIDIPDSLGVASLGCAAQRLARIRVALLAHLLLPFLVEILLDRRLVIPRLCSHMSFVRGCV